MPRYLGRGIQCETSGCPRYASHELFKDEDTTKIIARLCEQCMERVLKHMNE